MDSPLISSIGQLALSGKVPPPAHSWCSE